MICPWFILFFDLFHVSQGLKNVLCNLMDAEQFQFELRQVHHLLWFSCVKFHFDHVQRIHRKRSLTLFQQCNITFKKTGFKVSVVCPPVAWQCAEHFGRMWQCQHCRKVSQHRALGGLQSQNIRTEVDLFHQSINFQISHFRFSLQTLSHTESSHLPLFKNKYIYIYIYIYICNHADIC